MLKPVEPAHISLYHVFFEKRLLISVIGVSLFTIVCSCKKNEINHPYSPISVASKLYTKLPQGLVSLTYDDGPGPGTIKLAKYLHDQNICATFFVVGKSDAGGGYINYPYLDSLMYYGQRIGSHTYNHKDLTKLSCQGVQSQLKMNHFIINSIIKNNLCYFTPPWFGWSKEVANCVLSDSSLNGIRGPIGMDFDTQDYLFRNSTHPEICAQKFLDNPINQNKFNNGAGGIIKMHDFNSYTLADFALQETKIIVEYLKSKDYTFVAPTLEFSPLINNLVQGNDFSNNKYWSSNISYYSTIRLKDVNGDKKADLIARDSAGIHVALSNGLGFGVFQLWSTEFSDAFGWKNSKYCSTLQYGDINGDEICDLVVQCSEGIRASLSNGSSFRHSKVWTSEFSGLNIGTDQNIYSRNVRLADVNGDQKADIILRQPDAIYVALSIGHLFKPKTLWTKEFSDTIQNGWKISKYNKEIHLADVNGDNMADVIGESSKGIMVSLSNGKGFLPATLWNGDFSGMYENKSSNFNSSRLGDVNGDGQADLLLRERDGIHVLLSNGHEFVNDFVWYKPGIIEQLNWNKSCYNSSFQCDDINGDRRADFIIGTLKGISGAVAP